MDTPLDEVEAALSGRLGSTPARASVSFVGVDPIEVLRFEPEPGARTYVSLGMSRHPMTSADSLVTATDGPRSELMLQLRDPTNEWTDTWRQLAVLAAAPTVEGVVYAPGMTVDLGQPLCAGSRCTGGLLADSSTGKIDTSVGPVSLLQVLPATAIELAWCRVNGTEALRNRWRQQAIDLGDLGRSAAALD